MLFFKRYFSKVNRLKLKKTLVAFSYAQKDAVKNNMVVVGCGCLRRMRELLVLHQLYIKAFW